MAKVQKMFSIYPPTERTKTTPLNIKPESDYNSKDEEKDRRQNHINSKSLYSNSTLFTALSPVIYSMQITGLFHNRTYSVTKKQLQWMENICNIKETGNEKLKLSQWYSWFMITLPWLNAVRMLSAFNTEEDFGPQLLLKIIFLSWFCMCAFNASICLNLCNRFEHLPKFIASWTSMDNISRRSNSEGLNLRKLKRRSFVYVTAAWSFIVSNIIFMGYSLFFTYLVDISIAPFDGRDKYVILLKTMYLILNAILSCAWILPVVFDNIMSYIFIEEFKLLHRAICKSIEAEQFINNIDIYRKRHNDICKLLNIVDNFLSKYKGMLILLSVCGTCLLLYNILWHSELTKVPGSLMMVIFWLLSMFTILMITLFSGAAVNTSAHELVTVIYDIDIKDTSTEFNNQLHLFLSRLTGAPIGFTVWGLFVIDKPMVLSIVGILITYFIVMLQFSPLMSSSGDTCVSNYTQFLMNTTMHCVAIT